MGSILGALIEPVAGIIEKLVPDKDKARQLAHEIATLAERQHHEQMLAQLEVNKVEAAHNSLFVSGWRPFVGWVCGSAMVFNFMCVPILSIWYELTPMDWAAMSPVLMGMLGLAGMRTGEKIKRVARDG